MPSISVIVPAYNSGEYLGKCINSILNQTFKDFEIILVDDGSTDNTRQIAESCFDGRIRYYYKENGGLSSARNFGIGKAKGDYIVFVDSDDYIDADEFEFCLEKIKKNNADIILCGYYLQTEKSAIPVFSEEGMFCGDEINKVIVDLKVKNLIDASWNKMFKASFIKENKLMFPEGEIFEDTAFNLTALSHNPKIYVSEKCFYHYVQHLGSITKRYNPQKLETIKERARLLSKVTSGVGGYCDFYYIKSVFSAFMDMFLSLESSEIKENIRKEISTDEFKAKAKNACFGGISSKMIINTAKSLSVSRIYAFCKFSYALKYKNQRLFLRVK